MVVERENENIVIKINADLVGIDVIQKAIDHLRILESNAQNKGTQEQADELASEINKRWWAENKHRFIK